ncbi:MAG: hypothetical protein DRR06_08610 [Gammaproteobacteria bacterium]|nr:MAG: hypothetical protein DRR42_23470 [Gammaproteobacteria bacterium]RLA44892.1 MAG: hypothetical protein DRR06_08610 [Gammaproteobacteria bacterium]
MKDGLATKDGKKMHGGKSMGEGMKDMPMEERMKMMGGRMNMMQMMMGQMMEHQREAEKNTE